MDPNHLNRLRQDDFIALLEGGGHRIMQADADLEMDLFERARRARVLLDSRFVSKSEKNTDHNGGLDRLGEAMLKRSVRRAFGHVAIDLLRCSVAQRLGCPDHLSRNVCLTPSIWPGMTCG